VVKIMKKNVYRTVIILAGSVCMALQLQGAAHGFVHVVNASTKSIKFGYASVCGGRHEGPPTELGPGQRVERYHYGCRFEDIKITTNNLAGQPNQIVSEVSHDAGIVAIVVDDPQSPTGLLVVYNT
jgi:hypothetical protein